MQLVFRLRVLRCQQIFLHEMQRLHIHLAGSFIARSRDNANDRHRRRMFVQCVVVIDVLSDGIFPCKIFLRERVVDDDRAGVPFFTGQIFRSKSATAKNRHSHEAEVIGRNHTSFRRWPLVGRNRRSAGYVEEIVIFSVVEWTVRTYGRGFDSGNTLHALEQLRPKRAPLLACFVLRHWQGEFEIYNAMRIETERRVLRVPEAF